jgi:alkylation response protein AidB-like acyl-CoA dehydrogenase
MTIPTDPFLSEEQVHLQELAHKFAEKEIRPIAMELDHKGDPVESFYMPRLAKKFHEVGLHAMSIPEEFGGGGVDDLFTHCIVAEELGWGDRGVVGLLLSSNKITRYMTARELATPEQAKKWLTAYAKDPEFLIAQCMTEDQSGSENLLPYNGLDGGFRTSAVREGNHYVVNGVKRFISNAGYAKLYFMYVRTDRTKGINDGSTLLMIPIDTPGLSFGRVHDKMGYRLNLNREIIMDNCRVPVENRLGPENYGISRINSHLRAGDGLINAAAMIGLARAAYETALDYAETRKQSGKKLISHQAIGLKLVEMYSELNAARSYVWQAARMIDNRERGPVDLKMPGSASMFAHEMACKVTRDAMEIFGGSGVMRELPIEMYLRNAYNMLHSDGGIIMKKLKVMRQLNLEADADINLD